MKKLLILALTLAAFGCAEQAPPYRTIQLKADTPPCTSGALGGFGVCSFSVSVLRGRWIDQRPESLFEAACVPYGGDVITIGPLEALTDVTVYMEFFSDDECADVAMVGMRGGVEITEEVTGPWYIPTFPVGGSEGFPVLSQDLRTRASQTPCSTDDECLARDAEGNYVLSPLARCGEGSCTLPETLFPLNMAARRAFHDAVALGDGRVALIGGFGREVAGQYFATDDTIEIFDPFTVTFSRVTVDGLSGQRLAFHDAVSLGGQRFAVTGGAASMAASFVDASQLGAAKRTLTFTVPNDAQALSSAAYHVDLGASPPRADVATLQSPVAAATAVRVGDDEVLVTGGVITGAGGIQPTGRADLCTLGEQPSCQAIANFSKARSLHCGVCLTDDEPCGEVMFFGGLHTDSPADVDAGLGELFMSGDAGFTPLARGEGPIDGNVVYPTCAGSGDAIYLTGGMVRRNVPPSLPPLKLSEVDGTIVATALGGVDKLDVAFRVHTASVALGDGAVLVSGGLDERGRAIASAYVIRDGVIEAPVALEQGRFGHTATLITRGPLAGAVLLAGGFTTDAEGNLRLANGAELFIPEGR